ncbi:MAG: hypothetical protein H0U73_00630 [Tatlockia sp.]|nr:hypothetical protein [Tatlockia sp.]
MTLFQLLDFLSEFKENYPEFTQLVNELKEKIALRMEHQNFQSLYDDEIKTQSKHIENNPLIKEFQTIQDTLRAAYIRYLAGKFKNPVPSLLRNEIIQSYLEIIESIEDRFKDNNIHSTFNYFKQLKKTLRNRIDTLQGRSFLIELEFIKTVLINLNNYNQTSDQFTRPLLKEIKQKFNLIINDEVQRERVPILQKSYEKYQSSQYKIQDINQHFLPEAADSEGLCYGIVHAMIIPESNPYLKANQNKLFRVTSEIDFFQYHQASEIEDRKVIKKTRLTREHSCPNLQKQAQEIFTRAKQHLGKDLQLKLGQPFRHFHLCYINVISENEIRYMDPNHGAYCFFSKEEFIEFYVSSNQILTSATSYVRYELSELRYAPNELETPHKIFEGKFRSFLTGSKYLNPSFEIALIFFHVGLGLVLGSSLGFTLSQSLIEMIVLVIFYNLARIGFGYSGALAIPRYFKNEFALLFQDNLISYQPSSTNIMQQHLGRPIINAGKQPLQENLRSQLFANLKPLEPEDSNELRERHSNPR